MSGKSTLAKKLVAKYRSRGIATGVLDPLGYDDWNADFQTDNAEKFMEIAKRSQRCALFLDESGDTVGRYNDQMFWLATRARHNGHKSHFITQRGAQLNKTVRDQCTDLFTFLVSADDAKILANEFVKPELREANALPRFHYMYCGRFDPVTRGCVTP